MECKQLLWVSCAFLLGWKTSGSLAFDWSCTKQYNATSATVVDHQAPNRTCIWVVETPPSDVNATMYVLVSRIHMVPGADTIKIFDGKPDTHQILTKSSDVKAPAVFAVTSSAITIVFETGAAEPNFNRTLAFEYKFEPFSVRCNSTPVEIVSPLYLTHNPLQRVLANYTIPAPKSGFLGVSFSDYNVASGLLWIYEVVDGKQQLLHLLTGNSTARDVVAVKGGDLLLRVDFSQSVANSFRAAVAPVTPGGYFSDNSVYYCSGSLTLGDQPIRWSTTREGAAFYEHFMNCQLTIETSANRIWVRVLSVDIKNDYDRLLVYNQGYSGGYVLGQVDSSGVPRYRGFMTGSNRVLVSFQSMNLQRGKGITLEISKLDHGGALFDAGNFSLDASAYQGNRTRRYFKLIAPPGKKIALDLTGDIEGEAKVRCYERQHANYTIMREITRSTKGVLPYMSMRNEVLVMALNLKGNMKLSGSFRSVDPSPGDTLTYADTYGQVEDRVGPDVKNKIWIIRPQNNTGQLVLEFEKISLPSDADWQVYSSLSEPYRLLVDLKGQRYTAPLSVEAGQGVFLNFTRGNDSAPFYFRLVYYWQPDCAFTLKGSEGSFSTPGFPAPYPLMLKCTWHLRGPVAVSFDYLKLGLGHTLTVKEFRNKTLVPVGHYGAGVTQLPDFVCDAATDLTFELVSSGEVPPAQYASGLAASYRTADCGGFVTDLSQGLATPNYPAPVNDSLHCVWLVGSGKNASAATFYSELQLQLANTASTAANLTLRDGGRSDSPSLPIKLGDEDGQALRSSSQYVLVEYKYVAKADGTTSGLAFKLTGDTGKECPVDLVCGDKARCMLPAWRCDGKNDCGDWTDEIDCGGGGGGGGGGGSGSHGVSVAVVGVLVPVMFFLGVVLALVLPRLVQRYRGPAYSRLDVPT